jgi:hypothetical protein
MVLWDAIPYNIADKYIQLELQLPLSSRQKTNKMKVACPSDDGGGAGRGGGGLL